VVLTRDQLSPAEQALWDAYPGCVMLDLHDAEGTDGPQRTVRAEVVTALLRGANPAAAGQSAGVRLTGARVTGILDLNCATVTVPLQFWDCQFDEVPDFTDAVVRGIRFLRCELPGFDARLMTADGDVDFRGSIVRGRLNLIRSRITGELRLTGAQLINPDGWALFAGGLVVESAVFGSIPTVSAQAFPPLRIHGGVRLAGAQFLSGVFLDGVTLDNPGKVALQADNMTLRGRMLCGNGFTATGRIQITHAQIAGELSFAGASLTDPDVALSLNNSVIDDLNLRTAGPPTGAVDLRHVRCTILRDDPTSWPATIELEGLVYEAIDTGRKGLRVADRLRWLGRDRDYRPQPYEQLAGLLRRLGADADARRVLLHKQRLRRQGLRLPARIVGQLLDWTVGYGYRPWRAALWLVVLLAAGTAVFSVWRPTPDGTTRPFDAVIYTLDLLVPISVFGLRDGYVPVGATRWMAYLLTAAGWLLATAIVAGVTRALRRD
jgi:hypothetical protein